LLTAYGNEEEVTEKERERESVTVTYIWVLMIRKIGSCRGKG
jgi:hypothetical protein